MIHTFEIYYPLNRRSAVYCVANLNRIAREYGPQNGKPRYFSDAYVHEFLDGNLNSLIYHTEFLFLGLHHIKFTKKPITASSALYFIYFRIEPEVFITHNYSLNLFQCNENNYDALQSRFGEVVYQIFPKAIEHRPLEGSIIDCLPDEEERRYARDLEFRYDLQQLNRDELEFYRFRYIYSILYLGLAKIARVDYTADFHCEYPDTFIKLVRRSYVDHDRKKRKLYLNNDNYLAAYHKTVDGFVIYGKQKKYMLSRYDEKPNIEQLRQAAANVIRIEYVWKCRDRKKQIQFTRLNLPARGQITYVSTPSLCGMMPYIIQDIGAGKLREEYYKHIGGGQWMSDYHWYDKTLAKSDLTETMKQRVYRLAYLISEVRHLNQSEAAFVQGRDIQRKRGPETLHVQGHKDVFRNYINIMRRLGLQPFRIPETENWKVNGKIVTHVSSEYDNFTMVDMGIENHEILNWICEHEADYVNYESTVADLKAMYNRYRPTD